MTARQRIGAALILGNSAKADPTDFHRCLRSLDGHVDVVFIAYNGDGDYPELPNECPQTIWGRFDWQDDFSVARNQSFDLVHSYNKTTGSESPIQWLLWIDSDDTLEGGDQLQELIADLDSNTQGVFLRYDYAVDPETEQVLAVQWRERLFRLDVPIKWFFPIHELARTPIGTQYARRHEVWIRHWRQPKMESSETRERNRRILTKARRENPGEARFQYYFANEVYAEAAVAAHHGEENAGELIAAAIRAYEEFIPQAPSPDDAYLAAHQIAELYRMNDEHLSAIENDLQALMVHPSWPDAYVGIAQSYMAMQDWDKVEFWADACLKVCAHQDTTQIREPLNDEYIPRLLLGIARENKGDLPGALEQYEKISELGLTDEVEKKIHKVVEAIENPEEDPATDDLREVRKIERNRRFGSNLERSIAFFTRPLFEPWHPEIVKEGGIGGAETCVIEVAQRFAADGWRVAVFGTPGDYWGVDDNGIEWYDSEDFLLTEPFTVFVSSRCPEVFDSRINADISLLWMHDVNTGENMEGPFGPRLDNIDYVIGLTDWHCNHLRRIYDIPVEKIVKIPNGVDLARFEQEAPPRQEHKFIWSSSPDRGIDVVINQWPEIRKRWPDAELHVFYGWHSIDKILEYQPENTLGIFKRDVNAAIEELGGEDGGIFWHDRIDQWTLAREMMTCDAWLYPTYFQETFCITSIEMQAAGVIPVTSDVAALRETNPCPRVSGWPNNVTFNREYIKLLEELMADDTRDNLREQLKDFAWQWSWDHSFDVWRGVTSEAVPCEVAA